MPLPGQAAIAMWWNMAPEHREEFEHWHSHEHFPERLGIPGFLRGSRWSSVDGGDGFFIMYELDAYETLSSEAYLSRLNRPTPWSTKMMPHHRDMVRSQCRVISSVGGGTARYALTLRVSPEPGSEETLRHHFAALSNEFVSAAGGVACHLLRTETPKIAATTEQQIRGGKDAVADWIVVAIGYDRAVLQALQHGQLSQPAIEAAGARPGAISGLYQLSFTAVAGDLKPS
ncbi:MAG: hypothetical protein Q8R59_00960 [Polaromonas sp.]|nr:hypothetical protein [Polaromonas sp.]